MSDVAPATRVTFDPSYPTVLQNDGYSCAPTSTEWAMRAVGQTPEPGWIEADMLRLGYVTTDLGLMDHRGAGIVEWLSLMDPEHYGVDGFNVSNWQNPISWEQLTPELDPHPPYPVLLGLPNWGGPGLGHWVGVRGVTDGRIQLANPATGGTFGQQSLSRDEFVYRAANNASVVRVLHPDLIGGATTPQPPATTLRGVDVASYQGYPDWGQVAASGVSFAITKVSEDDWYANPYFGQNWRAIRQANLVRGCYHFARPSMHDATTEADYMLAMIAAYGGPIEPGDLLALDLEAGSGDLGPWTLEFLHRVEAQAGVRPLVYTGAWFSGPHNLGAYPEIGTYALWLAAYQATQPTAPPPWSKVSIWQNSSTGSVPGIAGEVDTNLFGGTVEQLRALGKPAAAPPWTLPNPEVGSGLLQAMQAAGTTPASHSTFLPLGRSPAYIEECVSMDGTLWRWHLPTGTLWKTSAD